jgi:hypothetical protein
MNRRFGSLAGAAATVVVMLATNSIATAAATPPVSNPDIIAHFDRNAGQSPEDMALEPDGAADISMARASSAVRVTLDGHIELLGQLPRTGGCPFLGFPVSAGIARADDGSVYLANCTGNADTGIWRLRHGAQPTKIAQLPANSFPNDMALDEHSDNLYLADSLLGVVWTVPTTGGTPRVWATGPALARSSLFGANGVDVQDHAVWVGNTDQGTILQIPINRDGTAGAVRTAVAGLTGAIDNFTVFGRDDAIIAALAFSNQVILIHPGAPPQVVLTAADGLSTPTDVALRHDTIYVSSFALPPLTDPNLLVAHLARATGGMQRQ